MQTQTNSTDQAIEKCESIINDHKKAASILLNWLGIALFLFMIFISIPYAAEFTVLIKSSNKVNNNFYNKLAQDNKLTINAYDSLITKAILYQKLQKQMYTDISTSDKASKTDFSDYIQYGLFILIFGVLTSLYRLHLKEINKQEHFLIGFQRIRIAGQNASSKFDGEVTLALTKDAFTYESVNISKNIKVESPIPGHPTSDIVTNFFNKILEKVDVVISDKKTN